MSDNFKQVSSRARLFSSDENWMESNAVTQLKTISERDGMLQVVGLPDLHMGKGGPVGAAFMADGLTLFHGLVGNDVGCGMALFATDLPSRKAKVDKWERKLRGLESPWEGDVAQWIQGQGLPMDDHAPSMGTIGGGNHFAEVQSVHEVMNPGVFSALKLDAGMLAILVHSGSRSKGQSLLLEANMMFPDGRGVGAAVHQYLEKHDEAVRWSRHNRSLIARRLAALVGADIRCNSIDVPHNFVQIEGYMPGSSQLNLIHRKGAAPSNRGPVVIPGSRGTLTYVVQPVGDQSANLFSVAHGAGRKWARSDCEARLRDRYDEAALSRTDLGGRVICEDRDLLYEEAPQAYKDIDRVVQDLVDAGLVQVVCTLKPVLTYKTRRAAG